MQQIATKKIYTLDEYFALETALVETKHEFFNGDIFAMAGAHPNHNTLCVNLIGELRDAIKRSKKPCRVFNSDQRVRAVQPSASRVGYFYPDVSIVCGKPEFSTDNPPTLLNPTLIIEVLSDSTREYDFGKKLDYYRAIESVQEIVFVSFDKVGASRFHRQNDAWILRDVLGLEQMLTLESLEISIPLTELYRDVIFA
jgi:Uma2 family endonuclease